MIHATSGGSVYDARKPDARDPSVQLYDAEVPASRDGHARDVGSGLNCKRQGQKQGRLVVLSQAVGEEVAKSGSATETHHCASNPELHENYKSVIT